MFAITSLVLPVLTYETQDIAMNTDGVLVSLGDEPDSPAFDYWYAPSDSFGMSSMRTINWTHFKDLIQDEIHYIATYKLNDIWHDGNQYLTFNKKWNESGFWKLSPEVNIPVDIQGLNVTFWCNKSVLSYFERNEYEIMFNISANETETYSLMFNYSDLKDIQGLSFDKGVYNNKFYMKISRGSTSAGIYEFDPTFGDAGEYAVGYSCIDIHVGLVATMGAVGGTANYVKAYMDTGPSGTPVVRATIWKESDSTLVAVSAEVEIDQARTDTWYQFNLNDEVLEADTDYIICVWGDLVGIASPNLFYQFTGSSTMRSATDGYHSTSDPGSPESFGDVDTSCEVSIYCDYTETAVNNAPTVTGEQPTNGSTEQGVQIAVGCTVNDEDGGDTLTATFATNISGSWVNMQTNGSLSDGNVINWTYSQANSDYKKYWWRVYIDDATVNVTYTFYYTTVDNISLILDVYTTKDDYTDSDVYINVTDPPDPPDPSPSSTGYDVGWWTYPEKKPYQIAVAPKLNWSKCKPWLSNHIKIFLEGKLNSSDTWIQNNEYLTVNLSDVGNNTLKSTWTFDAPITGDYRLTVIVDASTFNVSKTGNYEYTLGLEAFNQTFNLSFNYSDLSQYSNLQFKQGRTIYNNRDVFYFRARRDNIPIGTHVVLDPVYTIYSESDVLLYYQNARKLVRLSNGTLYCAFRANNDMHIAYSEDEGATWVDREIWGDETSRYATLAVDSNDVVHLVFSSYKNDADDYQLEYTNSTNWNTIVQIRDEDKNHIYPCLAVDSNDSLHVVYEKGEEGTSNDDQVAYVNSTDNGGSWGTEQILTDEADGGEDVWFPQIVIDSNDHLHVVYECEAYYSSRDVIMYTTSTDNGGSWSAWNGDIIYQHASYDQVTPIICVDDDDNLFCTWSSSYEINSKAIIRFSVNYGTDWSSSTIIYQNTNHHSYDPSMTVNADGDQQIVFGNDTSSICNIYNNSDDWATHDDILPGDYIHPNMIYAFYPTILGAKTNRPKTGYAFICSAGDGSNITFWASDDLTWDTAWESKINNTGNVSQSGYLKMMFQYNNSGTWVDDDVVTVDNKYVTIPSGEYEKLDLHWNGNATTADNLTNGAGHYRVYAALLDAQGGDVIQNADGSFVNDSWEFNYTVANNAPTVTGEQPTNGSTGEELGIAVGCTVNDADTEAMTVTFATSPDGSSWTNQQTNTSVPDGDPVNYTYSGASSYSTKYYWKVYADDGTDNTTSGTWDFTTKAEPWSNIDPVISGEQPSNQSTEQELTTACGVTLTDSNSNHTFNVTYASNYSNGVDWVNYQTNSSVANNSATNWTFTGASTYSTKYWWKVFCHDGFSNISKCYHFTTKSDPTPAPTVIINFAGNLSDSGGPYWRPPGETTQLTGVWSDGYYTNNSRQSEDWIYINCTITNATTVNFHWLNETTWDNDSFDLTDRGGNFWDINTSGIITTQEGYNYSFDIHAVGVGGENVTWWNKTGLHKVFTRRHVQLNCTPTSITYTPFYQSVPSNSSQSGNDVLQHDQRQGTWFDTKAISSTLPDDTVTVTHCTASIYQVFDESVCPEPFTLENVYFHIWYSYNISETMDLGVNKSRVGWNFDDSYTSDGVWKSNLTYDQGLQVQNNSYHLEANFFDCEDVAFTDNDIYEFMIFERIVPESGTQVSTISNRSFTSFVIFNVPDNATLNATGDGDTDDDGLSDWTELYVDYTNPFLVDTDNDGVSDYVETLTGSNPNDYTDTTLETPTVTGEHPANSSVDQGLQIAVGCTVNDANSGAILNATFATNVSGSWVNMQTNGSLSDGDPINWTYNEANTELTKYWWRVYVYDGFDNTSWTFYYTTVSNITIDTEVNPTTWILGNINVGMSVQNNFTFYQNGSSTLDITIGVNDTNLTFVNYADWLSLGHDRYYANFTIDSWSSETNIEPGYPPSSVLESSFSPGNFVFGVRILMPRTLGYLNRQEDFVITLVVSEST